MKARHLSRSGLIALTLLLTTPGPAASEADERAVPNAHAQRWVPGIAIFGGALRQERIGAIDSAEFGMLGGDSITVSGFIGLSGELSTPELSAAPGRPRLFVHGDVSLSFDSSEGLANQGDPGRPVVPPINNFPALGVPNLGSALRSEVEPLLLSAGAGLSFALRAWEREIRIKPSVEWLWQEDKLTSLFSSAEGAGADPDFCSPCRTVFIDSSSQEDFHSLGPGLEIEVDAARVRDVVLSLFLGSQAYHLLGGNKVTKRNTGVWMTNGTPSVGRAPSVLRSEYERERWHYRFTVGLRFLWLPE